MSNIIMHQIDDSFSASHAFRAYAPRLWNELPDEIKAADSVQN